MRGRAAGRTHSNLCQPLSAPVICTGALSFADPAPAHDTVAPMRIGPAILTRPYRWRLYLLPTLLLLAFWLPGANQGWYRTDTHFYAAISKQAFDQASAAPDIAHRVEALMLLRAGDQPYMNKPPLAFWIHGLFIWIFGLSLWAARLPSLFAAIAGVWATVLTTRRLAGWRIAELCGVVLATSVEFFRYERAISLDLWMTLLVMAGVAALCGATRTRRVTSAWWIWSGVAWGLALMTKPFVALFAPVLLSIWLAWVGRRDLLGRLWLAALVAVIVAAPWHIAAGVHCGEDFWRVYVKEQSLERAISAAPGSGDRPVDPPWFYLRIMLQTYWPWLVTLVLGLAALVRGRLRIGEREGRLLRLSAVWCLGWLLVISLSAGKAPRYATIIYPLLGALSAVWLTQSASVAIRHTGRRTLNWLGPVAVAGAIAAAAAGVRVHAPRPEAWDDISRVLTAREVGGAHVELLTTPRAHSISANLVMLGRDWPRVWRGERPADSPDRDMLLMLHPSDEVPSGWGAPIITNAEFVLVGRERTKSEPSAVPSDQ